MSCNVLESLQICLPHALCPVSPRLYAVSGMFVRAGLMLYPSFLEALQCSRRRSWWKFGAPSKEPVWLRLNCRCTPRSSTDPPSASHTSAGLPA